MKKILLCIFFLIGLTISTKNLAVPNSNFETKFKKEDTLLFTSVVNTCALKVMIYSTLDIPTSEFFVIEGALNGSAPLIY